MLKKISKISIKLGVCFMLALFILTLKSADTAFADTPKNVSVTVEKGFVATSTEINSLLNDYTNSNNSYNYDDGYYSGILTISNVSLVSQALQYPSDNIYHYIFLITYSGEVNTNPVTKSVSIMVEQGFTTSETTINSELNSYINSNCSYNYDDGLFSGTLYISNVNLVAQTLQYPTNYIYHYIYQITYSGTVIRR